MSKKTKDTISRKAKISRDIIQFFTSMHGIGPQIADGRMRKKLDKLSIPWICPKDFSRLVIRLKKCSMELLIPKQKRGTEVVLQLHGGGYQGRLHNGHRDFACAYASMPGSRMVLSLDYRVAPEHPYPAALEDAVAAYHWLQHIGYEGEQIILTGDSAGGGLCLALAMYLRDHGMPLPKCMVLMSPWTDLTASGASYETNFTRDPLFGNTKESMIYSDRYYGNRDPGYPYISPLFGNYEGLPPMLFQVGSIEMLLDDSVRAAKKAKEANVEVQLSIYEGMYHVFQMGMNRVPEAKEAWEEIEAFINVSSL